MDPIKFALKAPGTKSLKLKYDGPLSNFGFNCNFRRYAMGFNAVRLPFSTTLARDNPMVGTAGKCSPRHRMTINSAATS
jgi:hypothetical protein